MCEDCIENLKCGYCYNDFGQGPVNGSCLYVEGDDKSHSKGNSGYTKSLTHSHTMTFFDALGNKPFENTVGKGEISRNEQFLLFPAVFSTRLDNFLPFSSNLKLSSANSFSLEESKICRLVMG